MEKYFKDKLMKLIDYFLSFILLLIGPINKFYSVLGPKRLFYSRRILDLFKIDIERIHYYSASRTFNHHSAVLIPRKISDEFKNLNRQIANLTSLPDVDEDVMKKCLEHIPKNNGFFMTGDMEILFLTILNNRPQRIIEIGSGYSTLVIQAACKYLVEHYIVEEAPEIICVEPYEKPWLDALDNIRLMRSTLEDVSVDIFKTLDRNDILFIDSSHIIVEGNDVDLEFLSIIPCLSKGVVVHVHDIFTPFPYLYDWRAKLNRKWNEQYILEALITGNKNLEILYGLYFLSREAYGELSLKAPLITPDREPTSFYFLVV